MTRQKHLSSREKKKILTRMAAGASATAAAKEIKRNRRTVSKFLDQPAAKAALADMFEDLCRRTLESVSQENIDRANLLQKATTAAIATDKLRLLRNEPTSIQVSYLLDAVQAIRDMRQNPSVVSSAADPIEAQAPAPDLLPQLEQQPARAVVQPASYAVQRHGVKYYSVQQPEQPERRLPLQQPPDPD